MDNIEYEYTIAGLPLEVAEINNQVANLNMMGAQGWQLCAVYRHELEGKKFIMHYLKRVKVKSPIIKPA